MVLLQHNCIIYNYYITSRVVSRSFRNQLLQGSIHNTVLHITVLHITVLHSLALCDDLHTVYYGTINVLGFDNYINIMLVITIYYKTPFLTYNLLYNTIYNLQCVIKHHC